MSHVHAFSIHTYFFSIYLLYLKLLGTFLIVSFSLSLFCFISLLLWHLNANLLCLGTLFVPGHPLLPIILPHTSDSVIRRPNWTSLRTFPNESFILNAKSSCRTSLTPTYPLSSTIGDGGHYVTPRSLVHPCWSRSFTPTCMDSIFQYLSFLLC